MFTGAKGTKEKSSEPTLHHNPFVRGVSQPSINDKSRPASTRVPSVIFGAESLVQRSESFTGHPSILTSLISEHNQLKEGISSTSSTYDLEEDFQNEPPTPSPAPVLSLGHRNVYQWSDFEAPGISSGVYLKYEKHLVEHLSLLPREVEELLRNLVDLKACYSILDWSSNLAVVVTRTRCYVWNYKNDREKQYLRRPAKIVTLSLPIDIEDNLSQASQQFLPLVCIVPPAKNSSMAGLLACSPKGEVRYWSNIIDLSEDLTCYKSIKLPLFNEDFGVHLACHETKDPDTPCVIILGTVQGALFRINVSRSKGAPTFSGLTRPARSIFWNGFDYNPSTIVATALGNKLDNNYFGDLYVLTKTSLEKWALADNKHPQKYILGQDITGMILQELQAHDPNFNEINGFSKLGLLDIEISRTGEVIILVGYANDSVPLTLSQPVKLWYYLVHIYTGLNETSDPRFNINKIHTLKFTQKLPLSPNAHIIMPQGGSAIFVVFPEAVIFTTVTATQYDEAMTLRDTKRDKIIGFGAQESKTWHLGEPCRISKLHIITTKTGIMSCEFKIGEITDSGEATPYEEDEQESKARNTRELKLKINQCLTYTLRENNPLVVYLTPDIRGDLDEAVIDISEEILESRSRYLEDSIDMRVQLQNRLERLNRIVEFIQASGLLDKISPATRLFLFWNAEKLACAKQQWGLLNNNYASRSSQADNSQMNLLHEAVINYFQRHKIPIPPNEDIIREFYRRHVKDIGEIFSCLQNLVEKSSSDANQISLFLEANEIALTGIKATFAYRKEFGKSYNLMINDPNDSWTFQEEVVQVFEYLFHHTILLIRNSLSMLGQQIHSTFDGEKDSAINLEQVNSLKEQVVDLAEVLFGLTAERLKWDLDKTLTNAQQYRQKWGAILISLAEIGKRSAALQIAESYEDFGSLAQLSVEAEKNTEGYVRKYINKFGERFAYVLYDYYLEKDKLKALLYDRHAIEHKEILAKYLSQKNLPRLSWAHNIYMHQYLIAANDLFIAAEKEIALEKRKTILSIGKLSMIAAEELQQVSLPNSDSSINIFDKRIDYVTAHQDMLEKFRQSITNAGTFGLDLKTQAKSVMQTFAGNLDQRAPTFAKLYTSLAEHLLEAKLLLSPEGLVDLLTLSDVVQNDQFALAAEIVADEKTYERRGSSDSRLFVTLGTVWRRIFLHDRWDKILQTSNMPDEYINESLKNTALYQTLSLMKKRVDLELKDFFCPPGEAFFPCSVQDLKDRFSTLNDDDLAGLIKDYSEENNALTTYLKKTQLINYVNEVLRSLNLVDEISNLIVEEEDVVTPSAESSPEDSLMEGDVEDL
ncbi:hypothetical protein G9A89_007203 [Geosiphon pyriformis]|nr:hypothetical protein G9A89_007203 [Geosiphon pyriformis]